MYSIWHPKEGDDSVIGTSQVNTHPAPTNLSLSVPAEPKSKGEFERDLVLLSLGKLNIFLLITLHLLSFHFFSDLFSPSKTISHLSL